MKIYLIAIVVVIFIYSNTIESKTTTPISIAGGWTQIDLNVPKNKNSVKKLLEFAIKKYNNIKGVSNSNPYKLKSVIDAKQQVVAGVLYDINAFISQKTSNYKCEFKVWVRSWLNSKKLVYHKCKKV